MRPLLILILVFVASASHANEYISPDSVSWLPEKFSKSLSEQDCKIPLVIHWELSGDKIPARGVLSGQFAKNGQYDIAVICVSDSNQTINFYWGGPEHCPDQISSFGETIEIADQQNIEKDYRAYGGKKTPEMNHDAIEDILFGKSSIYYYCENNKWGEYQGAD